MPVHFVFLRGFFEKTGEEGAKNDAPGKLRSEELRNADVAPATLSSVEIFFYYIFFVKIVKIAIRFRGAASTNNSLSFVQSGIRQKESKKKKQFSIYGFLERILQSTAQRKHFQDCFFLKPLLKRCSSMPRWPVSITIEQ